MRFALLAYAAFLALLAGPYVVFSGQGAQGLQDHGVHRAVITASTLAPFPEADPRHKPVSELGAVSQAPSLASRIIVPFGAESLAMVLRPTAETMPLLPDIPAPVWRGAPDVALARAVPPQALRAGSGSGAASATAGALLQPSARIIGNGLNLRQGPSKQSASLARLSRGATVTITGARRGSWLPVEVQETGRAGWVFYKYVQSSG